MEKGKLVGLKLRDFLMFKYKRADFESFLDLVSNMKREFGMGEIEVGCRGPSMLIMLHHDYGRSHSVFFGAIADTGIQSVMGLKPKLQITDNSIVVEFTMNPAPLAR